MTSAVRVELHARAIARGQWCPNCLLPSAELVQVYGIGPNGVSTLSRWVCCASLGCHWSEAAP